MLVVMQICNGHVAKDIRDRKNPIKFDAAAQWQHSGHFAAHPINLNYMHIM